MDENVSLPCWALLPMEIVEKIFDFIPRLRLGSLGLVCITWGWAVHHQAVKYLKSCIQSQLIEERQLSKFCWSLAATLQPHHDMPGCNCIHLAFDFFLQRKRLTESVRIPLHSFPTEMCSHAIVGGKVFLGFLDCEEGSSPSKLWTGLSLTARCGLSIPQLSIMMIE
jgi:hypothetical protein